MAVHRGQGLLSCVHHGEMTNMLVDGLPEKEESSHDS